MADIPWDHEASLMRVTRFATTDDQEELVARGTVRELVGRVLAMGAGEDQGLLLRAAGPDWTAEHDADAIRELGARPDYTGAHGDFDTADREEDPDRAYEDPLPIVAGGVTDIDPADGAGTDGEK